MFGDDLNALVTTERFGFGAVFGRAQEGAASWQKRLGGHGQEGSENPIDLGIVNESKGDAATTNGCKLYENNDGNECRCNANDDMR